MTPIIVSVKNPYEDYSRMVVNMVLSAILFTIWLSTFKLGRFLMQKIVAILFKVAFEPLVRVSSAALAPVFSNLALDKAQIKGLVLKVGAVLEAKPVTYEVMGIYSAAQQQEIVEGVADMLKAILTEFGITQPTADIGKLLTAVGEKLGV